MNVHTLFQHFFLLNDRVVAYLTDDRIKAFPKRTPPRDKKNFCSTDGRKLSHATTEDELDKFVFQATMEATPVATATAPLRRRNGGVEIEMAGCFGLTKGDLPENMNYFKPRGSTDARFQIVVMDSAGCRGQNQIVTSSVFYIPPVMKLLEIMCVYETNYARLPVSKRR
eukprot:GHVU01231114.1.p2 GENE.GHVU01231114.1~~GHVU01231114.1.p2  ORF type:complete len:169 (+),score=22.93 GHVU01231114.1:1358-1864(+)